MTGPESKNPQVAQSSQAFSILGLILCLANDLQQCRYLLLSFPLNPAQEQDQNSCRSFRPRYRQRAENGIGTSAVPNPTTVGICQVAAGKTQ